MRIFFLFLTLTVPYQGLSMIDVELSLSGAIILSISYGYDTLESDNEADPFVKLAESGVEQFSAAVAPGAFYVDFIPWCGYALC